MPEFNTASEEVPEVLTKYRELVDGSLKKCLSSDSLFVYDMLRYCMGWADNSGEPIQGTTGKALRPSLCLFACEAAGGRLRDAIPVASSIELIHNFSLVHDEIQDFDETRHHRPTLWAVWGIPRALVAGNVLRIIADISVEGLRTSNRAKPIESVSLLAQACLEMIEGQYMDISYEGRIDISLDQYMAMISRKTGALIRCSLQIGAELGNVEESVVNVFKESGRALGYTFQIRDDILGIWGSETITGKPVGADIRRKKNSLPVVHAMSECSETERKALLDVFSRKEMGDSEVELVLDIMESNHTLKFAQELADKYCENALDIMESAPLNNRTKKDFSELAYFLAQRKF